MKVLLISANTETVNMIPLPLGMNCVAVAVRAAGHDVQLLDLMGGGDHAELIRKAIQQSNPALIGVSVRNVDNQHMGQTRFLLEPVRDIIVQCRALSQAIIVVGGAGFSIFPHAVLTYLNADMGICGEGEVAFTALINAMERGDQLSGIAGLCLPGKPLQVTTADRVKLADLPLPDPSLWSVPAGDKSDIWIPYQTRRGCPMQCAYCSTPALEGTAIRKHPVDEVVQGIARHVAAGFSSFYFVDNTFNFPPDYTKELCKALVDLKQQIRWRCILYPGFVDEAMVQLMAEAGCVEASLGFESGSPLILKNLNKKYTLAQVRTAAELLEKHGIKRMGFLLLGGPGETKTTVLESLAFADSLKLDMVKLSVGIRIYPETLLAKTALEEGLIAGDDDLLLPRFYLARGLEEWLVPAIKSWMAERPFCIM